MEHRITTVKHRRAAGTAHAFDVAISEPGRWETYSIVAHDGQQAVAIARQMFDGHPLPASFLNRMTEAA